jgi:hypothetical protein
MSSRIPNAFVVAAAVIGGSELHHTNRLPPTTAAATTALRFAAEFCDCILAALLLRKRVPRLAFSSKNDLRLEI